jgi:hypothetical protein
MRAEPDRDNPILQVESLDSRDESGKRGQSPVSLQQRKLSCRHAVMPSCRHAVMPQRRNAFVPQ